MKLGSAMELGSTMELGSVMKLESAMVLGSALGEQWDGGLGEMGWWHREVGRQRGGLGKMDSRAVARAWLVEVKVWPAAARARPDLWDERERSFGLREQRNVTWEREREREMSCETGREKEREEKYYFNEKGSKIIFFFFFFLFSSHEQCTSIYRCAL